MAPTVWGRGVNLVPTCHAMPDPLCSMKPNSTSSPLWLLIGLSLILSGCAQQRLLIETPLVYANGLVNAFSPELSPELQTSVANVLYVTDRMPETGDNGEFGYGMGRSISLAFGNVEVGLGEKTRWRQLDADAASPTRAQDLALRINSIEENVRLPPTPYAFKMVNGRPKLLPEVRAQIDAARVKFGAEIQRRLALTPHKKAVIYVHGVANTFADAAYTTAELWHFLGREGIPIAYTWPAGGGGVLRGYTYDRESSEFTVTHFKNFLRELTRAPGLGSIEIIAHSRGTDVVVTALRELLIESRARDEDPRQRYRINNLVLAAPDLNVEIMMARTFTERLSAAVSRMTIYTSKGDKAIGVSEFLFGGGLRLGRVDETFELPDHLKGLLKVNTNRVAIIEYTGTRTGPLGHAYFRENPSVASDLVLAVRYGRDPGDEHGRPLIHKSGIFWELDDSYLQ